MSPREKNAVARQKCMHASLGSWTPWARNPSHHYDELRVAFDHQQDVGDPDDNAFDAQYPRPHVPLSTLHVCPHEQMRMTRGDMYSVVVS